MHCVLPLLSVLHSAEEKSPAVKETFSPADQHTAGRLKLQTLCLFTQRIFDSFKILCLYSPFQAEFDVEGKASGREHHRTGTAGCKTRKSSGKLKNLFASGD